MPYVIRTDLRRPRTGPHWYVVLTENGCRQTAATIIGATHMTLPEAWCILQELWRDRSAPEVEYSIEEVRHNNETTFRGGQRDRA